MTADQLQAALDCKTADAERWVEHLNATMVCYNINTPLRQAAWLAQVGHESGLLTKTSENLNYSAERLVAVFPKHFASVDLATPYARNPERIANKVYANRMGNGDEDSGDGWRFRGRGLIQVTGRTNYKACAGDLCLPLIDEPDLLLQEEHAAASAGWFWDSRKLNAKADLGLFDEITKAINGGLNGQTHRYTLYQQAKAALGA